MKVTKEELWSSFWILGLHRSMLDTMPDDVLANLCYHTALLFGEF